MGRQQFSLVRDITASGALSLSLFALSTSFYKTPSSSHAPGTLDRNKTWPCPLEASRAGGGERREGRGGGRGCQKTAEHGRLCRSDLDFFKNWRV